MDILFSILELLEPYLPLEVSFLLLLCLIGVTVLLGIGSVIPMLKRSWRGILIIIGLAVIATIGLRKTGFFDQRPSEIPTSQQTQMTTGLSHLTVQQVQTIPAGPARTVRPIPSPTPAGATTKPWSAYRTETAKPVVEDSVIGRKCYVTASASNVRSGPGEEYTMLGQVYRGETYTILGTATATTGRTWFKISVNGQLCWISSGMSDVR